MESGKMALEVIIRAFTNKLRAGQRGLLEIGN
jgi:hypothetical protein